MIYEHSVVEERRRPLRQDSDEIIVEIDERHSAVGEGRRPRRQASDEIIVEVEEEEEEPRRRFKEREGDRDSGLGSEAGRRRY